MPDYKIREVRSRKELMQFVRFPDELYKDCPQYVPALHSDQVKSLTRVAPLKYCSHKLWLALDGNKVVGRISGMINPRYNELYGKKRARFGWFDCIKDIEVARLLLGTAEAWAKEQGMDEIHGPLYYNTFGKQGMLVEGYDHIPPFNCLYNFPYYNDFVQELGYEKECDWVQYKMVANHGVPEKARRVSKVVQDRYKLHFGSIDELKKDKARVRKFFQVYNESFASSVMNFIPLTDEEIEEEAANVMPYLSDKISCVLLDEHDEIVAFGISFPTISPALQKAKGKLFPFGWWYLLKSLYIKREPGVELLLVGVHPDYQNSGVNSLVFMDMFRNYSKAGVKWSETNAILETNLKNQGQFRDFEHECKKRRRSYIKKLDY